MFIKKSKLYTSIIKYLKNKTNVFFLIILIRYSKYFLLISREKVGRQSNPLSNLQAKKLKLTPKRILEECVINLNLKDIPEGFNYDDLEILTQEVRDSVLLINLPFNKEKQSFHEYCFILMNNHESAAKFCEQWNQKELVDAFGNHKKVHFHRGNNSPRKFIMRVLGSRAMLESVR